MDKDTSSVIVSVTVTIDEDEMSFVSGAFPTGDLSMKTKGSIDRANRLLDVFSQGFAEYSDPVDISTSSRVAKLMVVDGETN